MSRAPVGALVAVLLLLGDAAHAGTLTSATWLQVTRGFPMTRTTAQLGATGSSTAGSISVSLSYPAFATNFFVPKTSMGVLTVAFRITQGGAQHITATPSMANANQGIPGTVTVMTAAHVRFGVNQSMINAGVINLSHIPVNIGVASMITRTIVVGLGDTVTFREDFYAWTPHTRTFTGLTTKGVALPDVVVMGSFDLTAAGGGTVTLVSPTLLTRSTLTASC